ncbi:MAG: class I SAM-dependent methyltransferase [Armatimonadetes bacterium]|nr:class I SAM-dependent methyltransferase [Armatimonadota bacterium]
MPIATNYFAYKTAAERYAQDRPYFHPLIMDKIREQLAFERPVGDALDVGCGTGQSTVALREIAGSVVGVDASPDMLAVAQAADGVRYLPSPAENIPLPDAGFDLVTVSLAFHWFDRPRFFAEVHRLLHPSGYLVIYNNAFRGEMRDDARFGEWLRRDFLMRYPTPARNNVPITQEEAQGYRFQLAHTENYTNEIVFSPEQLVRYLLTQSNVIAAVEQGTESVEDIYERLMGETAPLFVAQTGAFSFGGYVWYLQKAAE